MSVEVLLAFSVSSLCTNIQLQTPVLQRQDPNVGCTLAACISFKRPVARCRCCARSQAPITAQKLETLGATFRIKVKLIGWWSDREKCGASTVNLQDLQNLERFHAMSCHTSTKV